MLWQYINFRQSNPLPSNFLRNPSAPWGQLHAPPNTLLFPGHGSNVRRCFLVWMKALRGLPSAWSNLKIIPRRKTRSTPYIYVLKKKTQKKEGGALFSFVLCAFRMVHVERLCARLVQPRLRCLSSPGKSRPSHSRFSLVLASRRWFWAGARSLCRRASSSRAWLLCAHRRFAGRSRRA